MLDYSQNDDEKKIFILNYEVDNGMLIIHLASGLTYRVPDTGKNREIVNRKMEEQVREVSDKNTVTLLKQDINDIKVKSIKCVMLFVTVIILSMLGFSSNISIALSTCLGVTGTIAVSTLVASLIKLIKLNRLYKDIEKNKFFLDNEKEINEGLKEEIIRDNITTKIKTDNFDINTVDKVPQKVLDEIANLANVQRNFEFEDGNFEEHEFEDSNFEEQELNHPKVKSRKREINKW